MENRLNGERYCRQKSLMLMFYFSNNLLLVKWVEISQNEMIFL